MPIPASKKTIIVGAGAAGLMAAITAAKDPGNTVTLLERQARVGKKLLATGNGRCNLTNREFSHAHYHGQEAGFSSAVFARFGVEDTLAFFASLGLLTVTEPSGRIYPRSDQANSVLDVLRFQLERAGVQVICGADVTGVKKKARGYSALCADGSFYFGDKLIVTCGGCAGKKLGGTDSGYTLLSMLGHSRTALHPSLCPIRTEDAMVKGLKGIRADCALTLKKGSKALAVSSGEVQFTELGISGPASFELSRAVSTSGGELSVLVDVFRDYEEDDLLVLLQNRVQSFPLLPASELFAGMLHPRLGKVLSQACIPPSTPLSQVTEDDLRRVIRFCKYWPLPVLGVMGFEQAQVTAGGVLTREFRPDTLESRLAPGVFAAGEVLDVDGDCGGYNLQWAWSSGYVAGRLGKEDDI